MGVIPEARGRRFGPPRHFWNTRARASVGKPVARCDRFPAHSPQPNPHSRAPGGGAVAGVIARALPERGQAGRGRALVGVLVGEGAKLVGVLGALAAREKKAHRSGPRAIPH